MRVVVAMSGGVDSSVSALLLREAGHDVVGVYLRNGVESPRARGKGHGCCGVADACDAEEVAALLGIPFYSLDESAAFDRIVSDFVDSYARGETPNPCIQCNRELKFGELLRFARALGVERVATGHYARCTAEGGGVVLRRARDRAKDQSYVLARVAADALARALFPVGELEKDEVRAHARRAGLPVHAKAESQEICFVPSGDYRDLLRERRPELFRSGPVRAGDGRELGVHAGAAGFTVGQRRGIHLAFGAPRYVLRTDPATNTVVVGTREELLQTSCRLRDVEWLAPEAESGARAAEGWSLQVRAHHAPIGVTAVTPVAGELGAVVDVALAPPGEAITPGQTGVLYAGERVVGSGRIAAR
jgi:tRNA-specific 2-thiouridylase